MDENIVQECINLIALTKLCSCDKCKIKNLYISLLDIRIKISKIYVELRDTPDDKDLENILLNAKKEYNEISLDIHNTVQKFIKQNNSCPMD